MRSPHRLKEKANSVIVGACRALGQTPLSPLVFAFLGRLKARRSGVRGVDFVRATIRVRDGATHEAIEMLKEELRLFPDNAAAAETLRQLESRVHVSHPQRRPNFNEEFNWLYSKIRPYTMVSAERLFALYTGAKSICSEDLKGNFAECGVAGGGSSALLAYVLKHYSKSERFLFAFDTFEGLPSPGLEDARRGVSAAQTGWGEGTCAAPVDCLRRIAGELDVWDHIVPIKGLFQQTLAPSRRWVATISVLHMDGDWYESTKTILSNFYDIIVPGGYVQVDDYGYWDGCRKALDEFEAAEGAHFTKKPIDSSGICFRKPH